MELALDLGWVLCLNCVPGVGLSSVPNWNCAWEPGFGLHLGLDSVPD
jgi:hypothetical protein